MNHPKKNSKVKEPKKAKKAIEELHNLVEQLKFFYPDDARFRQDVLPLFMHWRWHLTIQALSID